MKINALITFFSLCFLSLSAQVDKTAATMDIIQGFTDEFEDIEGNKKYLSQNITFVWPDGNKWPDGTGKDFEDFWNFYSTRPTFYKNEPSNIVVRELGNETYAFFTWKNTIKKMKSVPN